MRWIFVRLIKYTKTLKKKNVILNVIPELCPSFKNIDYYIVSKNMQMIVFEY